MGINDLLNLLNKKIETINQDKQEKSKRIEEIQQIHSFLLKIKQEPFGLYLLNDDDLKFAVELLSFDESKLVNLNKNKVIYEAYSRYGSDAVPQIFLLKKDNILLHEMIDEKIKELTIQTENIEKKIITTLEYETLKEEILDENKPISKLGIINGLLEEYKIPFADKLSIKLTINEKNKRIYQERLVRESVRIEESKYEVIDINKSESDILLEKFNETFNLKERVILQSISDELPNYWTQEEFNAFLEQCKYNFVERQWDEIIQGLIDLKNIEKLTTLEIIGDDVENYRDELNILDKQLTLLNDYYEAIFLDPTEAKEKNKIEHLSKLDNALKRYSEDVLSTPNIVLYLSDAIDKDIRSITEKETLQDAFILIEQLKYGEIEFSKKFTSDKSLKDLYELKPVSGGRQARVIYAKLSDNIYGIISVSAKKGDYPKIWRTTLEQRKKNCDIDYIRANISDKDVLDGYVNKTQEISGKFYAMVSGEKSDKKNTDTPKK